MKYLAFTIIFLASCKGSTTSKRPIQFDRSEVVENGHTYIIYSKLDRGAVIIDATKDSLTTELLKQTLERNDN